MAEQADVYVKHALRGVSNDIHVVVKHSDGSSDPEVPIAKGNQERFYLGGTGESLIISAPSGVDTKEHPIIVKADVDVAVVCSRTNSSWTLKIEPNNLPPETPTTVNVNVGDEET